MTRGVSQRDVGATIQVGTCVLENLNRLAQTQQTTRPVHDTLDYFVGHIRTTAFAKLRLQKEGHLPALWRE